MTNALKEDDIQKIISVLKEKMKGHTLLTAAKGVNKGGQEIFVYAMEEVGSLTLSADENGEYQLVNLEHEGDDINKTLICVGFNSIVKNYVGKDWPDKQ